MALDIARLHELRVRAYALDEQTKALHEAVRSAAEANPTKEMWSAATALSSAMYDTFGALGWLCKEGADDDAEAMNTALKS